MKKKRSPLTRGGRKAPLTTALLAAVAVGYLWFVFLPMQRSIDELQAQVQERRQQILQAETIMRTVALSRQRLADTQRIGEEWRAAAPGRTQLGAHFASLTQQAEAAGVVIERLDPQPPVELKLIAQQSVVLQLQAPFAAIFDLLRRFETMPGTVWMPSFRLYSTGEKGQLIKGDLTLTIFVDRTDYSD